jgi:diguanylate cyclase (GGDEF)-like protein
MKKIKNILNKDYLLNIDPIYSISAIGTSYLILYACIHFARKEFLIATIEIILVTASIINLTLYKFFKNKEFSSNVILFAMILFFDYLLIDGGIENTGIFWIYFYPILAFFLKDKLYGIYWNVAFIFSVIALLFLYKGGFIKLAYSEDTIVLSLITYSSIFIIMLFIKSNINFNYEQIEKLATTDSLTGIFNRFQIMKLLKMEVERADRYNKVFSVILFDIDNFKSINDTYGHQKGDMVLQKVASIFRENLRKTDYFGRFGGEEFIIVAPETKAEDAYKLAEKLRKILEKTKFDSIGKVTASFGIAQYEKGKDINKLLKEADDALYMAKREGKNRVCIFEEKGCLNRHPETTHQEKQK